MFFRNTDVLCYFADIFLTKRMSQFMQCLTDYGLRGIKVTFMHHLALLYVVRSIIKH